MFLAVYGEDSLRVREFAEDLVEKFVAKYDPSRLNCDHFDFATASREALISSLQASPFLAEKRFIFLKHVAHELKKADAPFWIELFGALHEDTSLCFVDELDEAKWKKSHLGLWLMAQPEARVRRFPLAAFSRAECIAWIRARAARMQADVSEHVAAVLYDRVGNSLQELALEIHKIATHAGGGVVSEDMLMRLVPGRVTSDFFHFLDLLPRAEPHVLVRALRKEEGSGSDPFGLFGGLLRQLRILVDVAALADAGITSHQEVAQALSLHPFVAQKATQAVKSFSSPALFLALEKAVFWDRSTKSGVSSEIMVYRLLEELLFARKTPVS